MTEQKILTQDNIGPEKIWGLEAIAKCLGVSKDTVRRLAKIEDFPIYQPFGNRYFAWRHELYERMRAKPKVRRVPKRNVR